MRKYLRVEITPLYESKRGVWTYTVQEGDHVDDQTLKVLRDVFIGYNNEANERLLLTKESRAEEKLVLIDRVVKKAQHCSEADPPQSIDHQATAWFSALRNIADIIHDRTKA